MDLGRMKTNKDEQRELCVVTTERARYIRGLRAEAYRRAYQGAMRVSKRNRVKKYIKILANYGFIINKSTAFTIDFIGEI
jgi:hypothetical protein